MESCAFNIKIAGLKNFHLNQAILIYQEEHANFVYRSEQNAFATVHRVDTVDGSPVIRAGAPMTASTLEVIARSLGKGVRVGEFLPPEVLSLGLSSMVWWVRPCKRRVWFSCNHDLIQVETAIVSHPGLVFGVCGSDWYVFAIKGKRRPTPKTPLFQAPYFNVWKTGKICQGTVNVPSNNDTDSLEAWNHAFFDSKFSHPNLHNQEKMVNYKGGGWKFWRDMLDGKFKEFPTHLLVSSQEERISTVGDLVGLIARGEN